jgi:hypothetical protein
MDTVKTVLDYAGYLATVLVILTALYGAFLWIRGIAPVLIRLGNGLSHRKIAIFAKGDVSASLHGLLQDSDLFRHANLIPIRSEGDIGKAEPATVFVIHWPDFEQAIDRIIAQKRDTTALILYAPPGGGRVPEHIMAKINNVRNSTVVNIRGRLMNDIVLSMITTSYEKK